MDSQNIDIVDMENLEKLEARAKQLLQVPLKEFPASSTFPLI